MVDVQSRVSHVQVAPDDLVACVGFPQVRALVSDQVIVIHIAMNASVAVEINVIHAAMNNIAVDLDHRMLGVNVDIADVNMWTAACDPALAVPAVVINAMPVPVTVVVQPNPDREGRTKVNHTWRI
jgi:hypothetical protein